MNLCDLRLQLQQLQQTWQAQWPGLERVVQQTLESMGLAPDLATNHFNAPLTLCMAHLAQLIESDGLHKVQLGKELCYHNRLHMAQAFVSMSCLLMNQRDLAADTTSAPTSEALAHRELLALLAMLAHDLFHPGLQNQTPGEIEQLALHGLQPHLDTFGVHAQDQADITYIILHTDPALTAQVHLDCQGKVFDLADTRCLCLLAVEADILVSALPDLGPQLTQFLAQEWAPHYPQAAQNLLLPKARAGFLKHQALFSSPASVRLGMPALVQAQLQEALE
jgi:hypothetical protein